MKTIDQMINELTILRDKLGGNIQVFFDKNGCYDGPKSITAIEETGYFTDEDGEGFYMIDEYVPESHHKIRKLVRLYSNRAELSENLENK